MPISEILKQIKNTQGSIAKKEILRQHSDNKTLQTVLKYGLDPFTPFNIVKVPKVKARQEFPLSEDEAWKDVDPNLPKSPFWYTEEPALGIGMRLVRPVDIPSTTEEKSQWWKADIESIEFDVNDRVSQGRGARGIADESLPKEAKELGFAE